MKDKLANRSDRKGTLSKRVSHNGMSRQKHGKFLGLSPEELRTQVASQRKFALKEAQRLGLAPVKWEIAAELKELGVPIHTPVPKGQFGTHAQLSLVPQCIADMVKTWEEAQAFAGPAAHVVEFRSLKLETVLRLAVDEWRDTTPGESP